MSKKVILVADDIEDVRQAIMRTLGEDNFTFLEASSGEAAIDLVKSQRVDLILSDIAMPKLPGLSGFSESSLLPKSVKLEGLA